MTRYICLQFMLVKDPPVPPEWRIGERSLSILENLFRAKLRTGLVRSSDHPLFQKNHFIVLLSVSVLLSNMFETFCT